MNDVQFTETAGGSSQMIGTFHSEDGLNNPLSNIGQRNNREVTLKKAKDAIKPGSENGRVMCPDAQWNGIRSRAAVVSRIIPTLEVAPLFPIASQRPSRGRVV